MERNRIARMSVIMLLAAVGTLALRADARAMDHVTINRDGAKVFLSGRVVVEAQDGGVLLLDRMGKLWTAQPDEIIKRENDEIPYKPLDAEALGEAMLKELPAGFEVHATAHYLICYNTSKAYAQWTGALFERLYRAFNNFWTRRGFKLREPEMPLVAIVFADKVTYQRYVVNELGDAAKSIVGYYNLLTNRVLMYDLTGNQTAGRTKKRYRDSAEINRVLSSPEAGSLVATIIHEATHQIAFNCGLQTRLADIPIWVSEGIAMYFETPDLRSSTGWRGLGAVNRGRLVQFRSSLRSRGRDSLETLMANDLRIQGRSEDKRYQGREAVLNAYAESWCLVYYLIKHKPKQFIAYMKMLAEKTPLLEDSADGRVELFRQHFGDLKTVDTDFVRQIKRLR